MWRRTHFVFAKKDEELLDPEVPYLSAIGTLKYLANCIRPNIVFFVNLLAIYSSAPTRRHWNGIKHILRYLRGTTDMGLFYSRESKQQLLGYADVGYLSDPHKGRSQLKNVFNSMFLEPDRWSNQKSYLFTVHWSDQRSNHGRTGDVINI